MSIFHQVMSTGLTLNMYISTLAMCSLNIVRIGNIFVVKPSPNTSMQISRNIGATMTASRKLAHDKVFNFFTKRSFFNKTNCIAISISTLISMN